MEPIKNYEGQITNGNAKIIASNSDGYIPVWNKGKRCYLPKSVLDSLPTGSENSILYFNATTGEWELQEGFIMDATQLIQFRTDAGVAESSYTITPTNILLSSSDLATGDTSTIELTPYLISLSPDTVVSIDGGINLRTVVVSDADYTVLDKDYLIVLATGASLNRTFTLPASSQGRKFEIHNNDSTYNIIVEDAGATTFEGNASYTLVPGEKAVFTLTGDWVVFKANSIPEGTVMGQMLHWDSNIGAFAISTNVINDLGNAQYSIVNTDGTSTATFFVSTAQNQLRLDAIDGSYSEYLATNTQAKIEVVNGGGIMNFIRLAGSDFETSSPNYAIATNFHYLGFTDAAGFGLTVASQDDSVQTFIVADYDKASLRSLDGATNAEAYVIANVGQTVTAGVEDNDTSESTILEVQLAGASIISDDTSNTGQLSVAPSVVTMQATNASAVSCSVSVTPENINLTGSVTANLRVETGNYTFTNQDYTVVFNNAALCTATLPAAPAHGQLCVIAAIGADVVDVSPNGSTFLNGLIASIQLSAGDYRTFQYDGVTLNTWMLI